MNNLSKITVIGAGNVGASCAQRLAERDYADIVLVDIIDGLPQGKALDILESAPILNFNSHLIGTNQPIPSILVPTLPYWVRGRATRPDLRQKRPPCL